jgi:NAD-dependent DNA ligase
MKMSDKVCQRHMNNNPNMIIPWLLMSSYAYYYLNEAIISDGLYDTLCREALLKWDDISHTHKKYITKDELIAGSLYKLKEEDYPSVAKGAVQVLLQGVT